MVCPVLLIAIAAWAVAQVAKLLIATAVYRKFDITYLTTGGGMPSSHSALVCATAVSCGMRAGFDSPIFAVAAVVAFIVMYDAAHVRRETGEQAKVLNYLLNHLDQISPELAGQALQELLGHTPLQVFMGALLGITVGAGGGFWLK